MITTAFASQDWIIEHMSETIAAYYNIRLFIFIKLPRAGIESDEITRPLRGATASA